MQKRFVCLFTAATLCLFSTVWATPANAQSGNSCALYVELYNKNVNHVNPMLDPRDPAAKEKYMPSDREINQFNLMKSMVTGYIGGIQDATNTAIIGESVTMNRLLSALYSRCELDPSLAIQEVLILSPYVKNAVTGVRTAYETKCSNQLQLLERKYQDAQRRRRPGPKQDTTPGYSRYGY